MGKGQNWRSIVVLYCLSLLTPLTETDANRFISFRFNAWSFIQVIAYYYNGRSFSSSAVWISGAKRQERRAKMVAEDTIDQRHTHT